MLRWRRANGDEVDHGSRALTSHNSARAPHQKSGEDRQRQGRKPAPARNRSRETVISQTSLRLSPSRVQLVISVTTAAASAPIAMKAAGDRKDGEGAARHNDAGTGRDQNALGAEILADPSHDGVTRQQDGDERRDQTAGQHLRQHPGRTVRHRTRPPRGTAPDRRARTRSPRRLRTIAISTAVGQSRARRLGGAICGCSCCISNAKGARQALGAKRSPAMAGRHACEAGAVQAPVRSAGAWQ